VTKFHQNRSTLKGRSAGQRQTDRQTWLKIMALQVCNRANNLNLVMMEAVQNLQTSLLFSRSHF